MQKKTSFLRQILVSLCIVAALGGVGFALSRQGKSETHDAPPPANTDSVAVSDVGQKVVHVETAPVQAEPQATDLHATGQILFSSDQSVKISPRLSGRVREVYVRVGDHVAVGQTLALLDSVDAAAAQNTARQNDNKLRLAKLTVDRQERLFQLGTPEVTAAQAALDQARTGVTVAQEALERTKQQAAIGGFGDPPLETAKNNLIQAKNALVLAQSDLAQAERDHDRKVQLVAVGVAAKSDLEQSTNVLEKAKAAVQSDQDSQNIAEQALAREQKAFGSKLYEQQQVRTAEAAYRQAQVQENGAQTALRLAKAAILTNLQQARSDYLAAQADAENAHRVLTLLGQPGADGSVKILAPISGVVTDRQVSPGQIVDQSQMTPWQMFTISNTSTVWVDADVYEKDISAIQIGQHLTITVAALPNKEFPGTVRHIAPSLDKTTRAVKVRAEIANANGLLKDGMYADVRIRSGNGKSSLTVPLDAILHDGDSDFVYVKEKDKYLRRQVTLGAQRNGKAIVEKGLTAGDMVVTHGALFLGNQNSGD